MRAPVIGERWEARRLLAVLTAFAVAAAMFVLYSGTAWAEHIPGTGQVPSHCVKFDFGQDALGTEKSPTDYPHVDITLVSWNDTPSNPSSVTFTIAGLEAGEHVEVALKSGTDEEDVTAEYGNGTHTASNTSSSAISHITLCVFEGEETTTTTTTVEDTTTTTVEDTTTTSVEDTTTTSVEDTTTTSVEDTTTTSVQDTSIEDEVLPTVVTTAPEVDDEDELPFTGLDTDVMLGLSILFLGLGAVLLTITRKLEEN